MNKITLVIISALGLTLLNFSAHAQSTKPCKEIKAACQAAGFKISAKKNGNGLYSHCVKPLLDGKAQPASAKLALPNVSQATISACNAKRAKKNKS